MTRISRRSSRGASTKVKRAKRTISFSFPRKTFFALLGIGVMYLFAINFQSVYDKVNTQRIEFVVIEGTLDYVSAEEVELAVFKFVNQALVGLSLDEIKRDLENNPWIKSVSIKREWPGTLIIDVSEKMAIARWGDYALLSTEGEIFSPLNVVNQSHLPFLSGPEGNAQEVMEKYQQFTQILNPQGLRIASLTLNSRNAWSIELESGIKIKLGTELMMERMSRLITSLDAMLLEDLSTIDTFDLRYKNGIAVSKKEQLSEEMVSL